MAGSYFSRILVVILKSLGLLAHVLYLGFRKDIVSGAVLASFFIPTLQLRLKSWYNSVYLPDLSLQRTTTPTSYLFLRVHRNPLGLSQTRAMPLGSLHTPLILLVYSTTPTQNTLSCPYLSEPHSVRQKNQAHYYQYSLTIEAKRLNLTKALFGARVPSELGNREMCWTLRVPLSATKWKTVNSTLS